MQLGVGNGSIQRAALDALLQLCGVDAEPAGQDKGFGHALDQHGHVGIDDELHARPLARFPQPHRFAADRVKGGGHDWLSLRRARCEDEQLS